jgi:hypothetical protein
MKNTAWISDLHIMWISFIITSNQLHVFKKVAVEIMKKRVGERNTEQYVWTMAGIWCQKDEYPKKIFKTDLSSIQDCQTSLKHQYVLFLIVVSN